MYVMYVQSLDRLLNRLFVKLFIAVPDEFWKRKLNANPPPITFSPAKNGTRMFFVGDHTFFGEVVNIAETLQTICWYKVVDVSLYRSRLNMFPLKQQQKSGLSFAQTTITTNVLYQIISLKVYIE